MARRSAQRANAKIAVLERLGHWWMCQDSKRGAAVLNEFYAGLELQQGEPAGPGS